MKDDLIISLLQQIAKSLTDVEKKQKFIMGELIKKDKDAATLTRLGPNRDVRTVADLEKENELHLEVI